MTDNRRFLLRSLRTAAAAVFLAACGQTIDAGVGAQGGRWTVAAVAAECQRSARDGQPGVVEITGELRDKNAQATITVPCILHLVDGAAVNLDNVNLKTNTLNIHDRSTGAAANAVSLKRTNITTASGILLELNDPSDSLRMEVSRFEAAKGIILRVAGLRGEDNSGGSITLTTSVLQSEGADTSGIQVLASEHSGVIRLERSAVNTPGPVTVLAAQCSAVVGANRLDCSTERLAEELGR